MVDPTQRPSQQRNNSMSRPCLLLLCSTLILACDQAPDPPGISRLDSAGVEVVTVDASSLSAAPRWQLSSEPVLDVGSDATSGLTLFRVVTVAPLSGGDVAIGMTAPPQVVVVDATGTRATHIGQAGEGPGEFEGVGSILELGPDSLAVWDPDRRRVSVFLRSGEFIRDFDLREVAPLSWVAAPNMSVLSAEVTLLDAGDGMFWLFSVGVMGPGSGLFRPEAPSYLLSMSGEVVAEVDALPGEATYATEEFGLVPYPLGADTHGASLGEELVVSTGTEPEVRFYDRRGSLGRILRWPDGERQVGGERLASWNEFLEEHFAALPEAEASFRREVFASMPEPERFPSFGPIVVSHDESLWVGPYHPGQLGLVKMFMGSPRLPRQEWLVLRPNGQVSGTVETPEGFLVHGVRGGLVWGVHTDALDVESVRAYQLQREGGL